MQLSLFGLLPYKADEHENSVASETLNDAVAAIRCADNRVVLDSEKPAGTADTTAHRIERWMGISKQMTVTLPK